MGTKTKFEFRFLSFGIGISLFCSSLVFGTDKKQAQVVPSAKDTVWVGQSDGTESCSPQSGTSLSEASKKLKNAHIKLLDSKKGSALKMHVQMCGASKGTMNFFLIPKSNLAEALALGYQVVTP